MDVMVLWLTFGFWFILWWIVVCLGWICLYLVGMLDCEFWVYCRGF